MRDQTGTGLNRVDGEWSLGRVCSLPAHTASPALDAFVGNRWDHPGGFSHHTQSGLQVFIPEVSDQPLDAHATDFFVVRKCIMNGERQIGFQEVARMCHRQANESFHVGAATAVQSAFTDHGIEWIGTPRLTIPGNRIGVARQNDAVRFALAQRCK